MCRGIGKSYYNLLHLFKNFLNEAVNDPLQHPLVKRIEGRLEDRREITTISSNNVIYVGLVFQSFIHKHFCLYKFGINLEQIVF